MRGSELAVDAIERVGEGVGDTIFVQILLQLENVAAKNGDIVVLRLIDPPDQQMKLARILRKICGNLFTDKNVRFFRYCKTAINTVVIGDGNEIHPALA